MSKHRFAVTVSHVFLVLALAVGALLVFCLMVLLFASLVVWVRGARLGAPETIVVSVICALVAWLFIAIFHISHQTITLNIEDREIFEYRVRSQLAELGYELKVEEGTALTFQPAFRSRLFGGNIVVHMEAKTARISGPKVYLERLQLRLRALRHLEPLQQSLAGSRRNPS